MKKISKLPLLLSVLGITHLSASNGTALLGYDPVTVSMAGSGVAMNSDLNLGTINPALVSGDHFSVSLRDFMPSVKTNGNGLDDFYTSQDDKRFVPSIAITHDMIPGVASIGFVMHGSGSMAVDYREDPTYVSGTDTLTENNTNRLMTSMKLAKFKVPIKLALNDYFTVGAAPVVQYGELSMSHLGDVDIETPEKSKDYGAGYEVGAIADLHTKNIVLGASYKSKIEMNYENQISKVTKFLGMNGGEGLSDVLEQPSELTVGASYNFYADNAKSTFTFDYKNIGYSEARGYKELGWEDQEVFSVGYEFDNQERLLVRLGYAYATKNIKELPALSNADGDFEGAVANYFNAVAFPAIIENHFSAGIGYRFSKNVTLNLSYAYSPEVVRTFDTSAYTQQISGDNSLTSSVITANSESELGLGFVYKF